MMVDRSEYPVTLWEPTYTRQWYGPLPAFDGQYTKHYNKTELGGKGRKNKVLLFMRGMLFRKGGRPGFWDAWVNLLKGGRK